MDLVEKPPVIIYTKNQKKRLRKKERKIKDKEASVLVTAQGGLPVDKIAEESMKKQPSGGSSMTTVQIEAKFHSFLEKICEDAKGLNYHQVGLLMAVMAQMRESVDEVFARKLAEFDDDELQLEQKGKGLERKMKEQQAYAQAEAGDLSNTEGVLMEREKAELREAEKVSFQRKEVKLEEELEKARRQAKIEESKRVKLEEELEKARRQAKLEESKRLKLEEELEKEKQKLFSGDKEKQEASGEKQKPSSGEKPTINELLAKFHSCVEKIHVGVEKLSPRDRRLILLAENGLRYKFEQAKACAIARYDEMQKELELEQKGKSEEEAGLVDQ